MKMKKITYFLFSLICLFSVKAFGALPTPSQVAPANASINQTPNVLIDWGASSGQTYYELVYGTDPLLLVGNQTALPTTSSFTSSQLFFGTIYYWKVRAMSATDSSAWTSIWQFTTIDICSLVSPSNGATLQPVDALLDWSVLSGSSFYDFQADTSNAFNSPLLQSGSVTASQANLSELHFNKTYFWRIRARHSADTTQWSVIYSFSTLNVISLVAPANGAVNQVCNVQLDWSATSGFTFYDYQYDLSNSFNSPLLFSGSATISSVNVNNLFFGAQYYWRVRIRHSADTSDWSQVWSFSTIDQLNLLSPVIGASNQVADQLIDWTATTGLTYYEYQADLNTGFNSPNLISGLVTASQVNLIILYYDTTYYWRVRGLNTVDTMQWSSTWNFSTMAGLTLVGPANGSTLQAPNALIDWSATSGFSFYDYQADTSPTFSSSNLQQGSVTASQVNLSNCLFGEVYYWRARARHSVDTMEWSSPWTLTIIDQLVQVSPANGATAIAVNPLIDWTALAGIVSYEMCIDDNAQFGSPQCFNVASGTSQQSVTGLAYGETYYWKVRAIHTIDTSAWSSIWSFTTNFQLTVPPVLISPADLSTNLATTINLDWGAVAGAQTYQWQVAENNQFVNSIFGATSNLTVPLGGLQNSTIYFWRVRANNGAGYSPWSTIYTFSTIAGSFITPPFLVSPADLSIGLPSTINFMWGNISGAVSYEFALDSSSIFSNPFLSTVVTTNLNVSSLNYSTQYYWRVRAFDGSNFSPWSMVYTFSTLSSPFANAPVLISPAHLSVNNPVSLNLIWSAYAGANIYEYQYDTDPFFGSSSAYQTTNQSENISSLQYSTIYYWRVRAGDGVVFTPWSQTRSFETEVNPLFVSPVLSFPADQATNVSVNLTFQWASVPTALSYQIEYDTDVAFSASTLGASPTNSFAVAGLAYDTTYFWRVRAFDGVYYTAWSNIFSFSTEPVITEMNEQMDNAIAFYPNPVSEFGRIQITNSREHFTNWKLVDVFGKEIFAELISEQSLSIPVSFENVSSAVYFICLGTRDGRVFRLKIIHQ
jgi:hypothetical protein